MLWVSHLAIKDVNELKKLTNELKTAEAQARLFDTQPKNASIAYERAQTGIHELAAEHKILSEITKANSAVFEKQGLQFTANAEKHAGLIANTEFNSNLMPPRTMLKAEICL